MMNSATLRASIEMLNPCKPICVEIGTQVYEVIKVMKDNGIGCVCVVDNHELVGIFTERDVLIKVIGGKLNVQKIKIEDVMTPHPEYLFQDDQIAFALNRMHVGGFRHIPLLNFQGQPTGIISVKDIIGHLVKNLDAEKTP
ncbi:MAG: cyclic nucleotide-binding/CBS domain-containing protein [bacterium]